MIELTTRQMTGFAERILFSTSLEQKFSPPAESDRDFNSYRSPPDTPARPPGLEISALKKSGQHAFPGRGSLSQDRSRGLVLHFFANHELLALELMALSILKFQDAPHAFLRGIVQTMVEEQNHMRLYLARMTQLGVEFGSAPLNGFFWTTLKEISSPQEYAAAMSLTFEQANLDYSLHFSKEFRSLGDIETAAILEQVHREEIGHVKHGVVWLERWRTGGRSLWSEYRSLLKFPLTPMRGKGPTFDRQGRTAAGLPDDFIEQMEVFSSSKGRPANVFVFNPGCEEELFAFEATRSKPSQMLEELTADLSPLMAFLAKSEDIVLLPEIPSKKWQLETKGIGFDLPEFIQSSSKDHQLHLRKFSALKPWGWSPKTSEFFQPLCTQLVKGSETVPQMAFLQRPVLSNPFSKIYAASLRSSEDLSGRMIRSLKEAHETLIDSAGSGHTQRVVFKSPYGSAGRNTIIVDPNIGLSVQHQNWIKRHLKQFETILMEPWVERLADLSLQAEVKADGSIQIIGITQFIVNARGQYLGHKAGKLLQDQPPDILAQWHATDGWLCRFKETAQRVGEDLYKQGYFGPFGIDGFLYRCPVKGIVKLQSLSEINPRYTMGRVFLEISKHCTSKTQGVWLHLKKSHLNAYGVETFVEFAEDLSSKFPLNLKEHNTENKQIKHGVYFTNPPEQAKSTLTMLFLYSEQNVEARKLVSSLLN